MELTPQAEWLILFGMCVAGKNSSQTEKKLRALLDDPAAGQGGPFERVRRLSRSGQLGACLLRHRLGKYKLLARGFQAAIRLEPVGLTLEALEAVPGIGPKTSRFIVLCLDPNYQCAALDTHILKFLRSRGYDAPRATPPAGDRYRALERAFLAEAARVGKPPGELDYEIWASYARPVAAGAELEFPD